MVYSTQLVLSIFESKVRTWKIHTKFIELAFILLTAAILTLGLNGCTSLSRTDYGFSRPRNGASGSRFGLPRFREASFPVRFPFGTGTGWSPFTPGDSDNSSLPVGALKYRFENPTSETLDAVFSLNAKNFMTVGREGNSIRAVKGGFMLHQAELTDSKKQEKT